MLFHTLYDRHAGLYIHPFMKVNTPLKRRLPIKLPIHVLHRVHDVLLGAVEWPIRRLSSVGRQPFFAPSNFTWIPRIEAGWTTIREELCMLRKRAQIPSLYEVSQSQLSITQDDKWKTYWLYVYGRKIEDNCRRCPETTRLVETIPGIKTAFFSILVPGKHIPEHRGRYTGVLRYHLGLIVPVHKQACRMRLKSEFAHWEEGRSLVFDDTYPHEVWNDTNEERAVLLLDFARPLPFPVSLLNEAMIRLMGRSGFTQEVVENLEWWNRNRQAAS